MAFSWLPFYHELAGKVLEFEDRQDELIEVLHEIKNVGLPCIPLADNQPDGTQKPLEVMDPFTFLAILARVETPSAIKLCDWLKREWGLNSPTPKDFEGRAAVQARGGGSWFFGSVESGRKLGDVENLWSLAKQAYEKDILSIGSLSLQTCVNQNNVGLRKLTVGLSWLSPKGFLPLGGSMLDYLKSRGVQFDQRAIALRNSDEYRTLMQNALALDLDYVTLTAQASQFKLDDALELTDDFFQSIAELEMVPLSVHQTPLNQILYGPPGTGKTFSSISKAVALIDGSAPTDRAKCQQRFHELHAQSQISFVTFHQSFSYEEFIEGLRPVIASNAGEVRYEIRDGVLKRIAKSAAQRSWIDSDWSFDLAWGLVRDFVSRNPNVVVDGRSAKSKFELSLGKDRIVGRNIISPSESNKFRCLEETARKAWDKLKNKPDITSYDVQQCEPQVGAEGAIHAVILNKMRDLVSERNKTQKFVLIIDEINRGNISKIFGELITLLEDDKRIGAPNELRVTLPTSGEEFALPPNLYILGTMNTADKSLAQLDVALRRRFEFEELPPRPDLCDKLPLLPQVLTALNERLEWAIDREHRLGHAYFMDVDSEEKFNARFRSKVVPLLIEYFPHDFETLRAVLGETSEGFLRKLERPAGFKGGTKYRWWFETEAEKDFSAFAQLKTNFGIS